MTPEKETIVLFEKGKPSAFLTWLSREKKKISEITTSEIEAAELMDFCMCFFLEIGENPVEETHIRAFLKKWKENRKSFFNFPTSQTSNLITEILMAGGKIDELAARKKIMSHSANLTILEDGKSRLITLDNNRNTETTIEIDNIESFSGNNKPSKKLFVFSLIKAAEQSIHNGELTQNYISFPLKELIDIGFYKTPQSARTGFKKGVDVLTNLKIKGTSRKGKKKISIDALEVLFTGARIENGQCIIFFNERINWNFLVQYFTVLPRYAFKLSNRAFDLLYYIFFLARQNTKSIQEKGYFTISFRTLQARLMLPNEEGLNNPQRDIKDAIDDAITEIEEESRSSEFLLTPIYDENASIKEYLDNGYLEIRLKGSYAEKFIELSKEKQKQIETAVKRKRAIEEKAKVGALQKALEAEKQ